MHTFTHEARAVEIGVENVSIFSTPIIFRGVFRYSAISSFATLAARVMPGKSSGFQSSLWFSSGINHEEGLKTSAVIHGRSPSANAPTRGTRVGAFANLGFRGFIPWPPEACFLGPAQVEITSTGTEAMRFTFARVGSPMSAMWVG